MPYLQIFLEPDLNKQEAQLALASVRDHFPLRQSEGRVSRIAANFLLIEQPEHDILTFEQELWLEQHAREAHIRHTSFYQGTSEGCRSCGHPFSDSPTGYCPTCHTTNPYQMTRLKLPLAKEEQAYLTHLSNQGWGNLRHIILTFLNLFANGHLTGNSLLSPNPTRFTEQAQALFHQQQTTCSLCGLPDKQCTCTHSTFAHNFRLFDDLIQREYVVTIPLSHQHARHLQELADQYGLTVETFLRILVEIPDIHLAIASREASAGQVLSIDFAFQLAQIAKQRDQGIPETGPIRAIRDVDGNTFSPHLFHFAGIAASVAQRLPLLEESVPSLLFDRSQQDHCDTTLTWMKEQLAAHDSASFQKAQPCTSDEITTLEALAGKPFPTTYKAFLAWMGHGAGSFLHYLTCFYPDLPALQAAAREMLATDGCQQSLPDDAWIISLLAEQHFTFLRLSEGDDPPIYAYRREWRLTPFYNIAHHLSDFLAIQVALFAEYLQHGPFQRFPGKGHRQRFLALAPRIESAMQSQQKH
jgi:hypothetical protein